MLSRASDVSLFVLCVPGQVKLDYFTTVCITGIGAAAAAAGDHLEAWEDLSNFLKRECGGVPPSCPTDICPHPGFMLCMQ